ncbi:MAG: 2-hydroxyacyl-CoA dehydratase [Desulfovermiculus sp.]
MPQMKTSEGRALLRSEYKRFLQAVEELTGTSIDVARLKQGIQTVNAKRQAMARLQRLRRADPAPISGLDGLLASQVFFYDNPERFTKSVNTLCDELETRVQNREGVMPQGTPRIMMSGCPMAVPNWKMPYLVESAGGVIVGEESCVGDSGQTVDELIEALVDRYFQIECAIFTPNPDRLERIKKMYTDAQADGVIHYSIQFCQPYIMESIPVEKALEAEDIPCLRVETDYSMEDAGQLSTRVEAFLEVLK